MTVFEALNAEVGNRALSEKIIIQRGLDPDDDYSGTNANEVEICKAYCFRSLVAQPDFSEDGLSINMNRAYMISEANRIFTANGLDDEIISNIPKVDNKSGLW